MGRGRLAFARRPAMLVICAVAVLAASASASRADSLTKLPLTSIAQLLVDPVGQHVFVSGGIGRSAIIVLDYNGAIVKTITREPGASGMALDTATHTLYVALDSANAIAEIDTQTLKETSRFSVAPFANPYSVVIAKGKLWFSCFNSTGCVASAQLNGTGVASAISVRGQFLLAAGGANGNLLATADAVGGPTKVSLYDLSSGSPTLIPGPADDPEGLPCGLADVSFDASGRHLLLASPCQIHVGALATSPTGTTVDYPTGSGPSAVAPSSNGKYVAIATDAQYNPVNLELFRTGSADPTWVWSGGGVIQRGLAITPDGSRVFAIVGDSGTLGFKVFKRYALPSTVITGGPASTTYAGTAVFRFSAHTTGATFQCKLDGSDWQTCTSPAAYNPSLGSHTFKVRAVLGDGNYWVDPTGASRTWTIAAQGTQLDIQVLGYGTVKSNPLGFICDSTCSAFFAGGTVVSLTAKPNSGSSFKGWSGACVGTGACSVTLSAAKSVKATFH